MKLAIFCLGLILTLSAGAANAEDFYMDWSGWSSDSSDADSNDDMEGGGTSHLVGTGALGKADSRATFDNLPWDGSSFCAYNDAGQAEGILLYVAATTEIARAANGDLLYRSLASSPPSTVCFNFVTSVAKVKSYYQIDGGTGRFKHATGETVLKLKVDVKQGLSGARGHERGKLRLNRRHRD